MASFLAVRSSLFAASAFVGNSLAAIPLHARRPHGLVWLVLAAAVGAGVTGWLARRAPPS